MTGWSDLHLAPQHVELLERAAVTPETARDRVFTVNGTDTEWQAYLGAHVPVPALVFCWTSPTGVVEYQARPDTPTVDDSGRPRKYVFRSGWVPMLWELSTGDEIWIVEGTKQALAAASWAPDDVAVYGIAGCRSWSHDNTPIPDLEVADGKNVTILLDADAVSNRDVYDAGMGLAQALKIEGAAEIKFARLPAGRETGLDDLLGTRSPERRTGYLTRIVAESKAKPADKPPSRKQRLTPAGSRPTVIVTGDRLEVVTQLTNHLKAAWDGTYLFNHGGVLARLTGYELDPLSKEMFGDLLLRVVRPVSETPEGAWRDALPEVLVLSYVFSRVEEFTPVERVARAPFIRHDGTVCQSPGYDPASQAILVTDDSFTGVTVPDDPTPEQVEAARAMLVDDWLGDMPFAADADRANALALILTPLIRGLVPRVPLAVVDGLQMGVGKNLLADCLSIFATGEACDPKPYTDDEDEQRKALTAAFRTGGDLFVFDEAHDLSGKALARALTSEYYSDRILGQSVHAKFPNRVTWASLGNNVQLHGDMVRRVYRIRLAPVVDNPMDRPASDFAHPDLRGWTHQHRSALVAAALTLIRAWFVAGQPGSERGGAFGSFEAWGRMIGGICELSGQPDFLGNLSAWRSENDAEMGYWLSHLAWARGTFGPEPFTSRELRDKALGDSRNYEAPPGLDDPTGKGYAKAIGLAYAKMEGRWIGTYRIRKSGRTQRHTSQWTIQVKDDEVGVSGHRDVLRDASRNPGHIEGKPPGEDGEHGDPLRPAHREEISTTDGSTFTLLKGARPEGPQAPHSPLELQQTPVQVDESVPTPGVLLPDLSPAAGLVPLDLETADRATLHTYGLGFVRLAGYVTSDGSIALSTDIDALAEGLGRAGLVTAHNGMDFDLVALARYHGLDLWAMVERGAVADTLLIARQLDPPPARAKGRKTRRYDLDALGERFGLGGKNGDLKAMAKAHGGYDKIPTDDPNYRTYLTRDVELQAGVHRALDAQLTDADRAYLHREHKVAALAARLGLNGFRVDTALLQERVEAGDQRKAETLDRIAAEYGVPLTNDKGHRMKSPLATDAGKAALETALTDMGVLPDHLPRTAKTGKLQTTGEAMADLAMSYAGTPMADQVSLLCSLVAQVTGERTIYHTIADHTHDGWVYPRVSMDQATGRWSTTRPGLTVIGKRGGRHVERDVLLADEGEVLVTVDYSQVDARAVAVLSGDTAYQAMFAPGLDLHTEIAVRVWGDPKRREDAKPLGHGWNYGMGVSRLAEHTGLGVVAAETFDRAMRDQFPRLVEWKREIADEARSGALLDNGFGRKMRPDPERAHTQGPAFMGQGGARDLMMHGLLNLPREYHKYLRAVVHDEVVCSVPAADAEEIEREMVRLMTFPWGDVMIVAEAGKRSESWGGCYVKD